MKSELSFLSVQWEQRSSLSLGPWLGINGMMSVFGTTMNCMHQSPLPFFVLHCSYGWFQALMTSKNYFIFIWSATLPHMLANVFFCDVFLSTPGEVTSSSLAHLFPLLKHTPLYVMSCLHSTLLSLYFILARPLLQDGCCSTICVESQFPY